MKYLFAFLLTVTFMNSSFAIDGYQCDRSDGLAVLEAKFTDDTRAEVQEVEGNIGFAVTSDYVRNMYSGKPFYAVTTFNLDNGGVLDVMEVDGYLVGLLRFSTEAIPKFYTCIEI